MASEIVVQANRLSKLYKLYQNKVDRVKEALSPWRRKYHQDFWALRNVSFEMEKGESFGIVGTNGSGKSTLLKILTGVTSPTNGYAQLKGRVASLLELGAGFNPELTGEENIFLFGMFNGIARSIMNQKVDEIAAFADIGEFLSQPIKIYSSGMFVRLAFACSLSIEPEILIVDEALSVGDLSFGNKCMLRIKNLLENGMSLIFVSHDLESVKRICNRGIWLDSGEVRYIGAAGEAVNRYHEMIRKKDASERESGGKNEFDKTSRTEIRIPLIEQCSDIELFDKRLFLKGEWIWEKGFGQEHFLRSTIGMNSLAAFMACGTSVKITFLFGDEYAAPIITVDGVEVYYNRWLEDVSAGLPRLEHIQIPLIGGKQPISISPSENTKPLVWLGGSVQSEPSLIFKRDPNIEAITAGSELRYGTGKVKIVAVDIQDPVSGEDITKVKYGSLVKFTVHAEKLSPELGPRIGIGVTVRDWRMFDIATWSTWCEKIQLLPDADAWSASFTWECRLPAGEYFLLCAVAEMEKDLPTALHHDWLERAREFTVLASDSQPIFSGLWYLKALASAASWRH